ncbi:MAG: hypothetical protein AB7P33_03595 [Dehalococcoidia bacterium]
MRQSPLPDSAVPLLGWAFLSAIAVTTAAGFVVANGIESTMEDNTATLLTGVLILVAFTNLITIRGVVLPSMAKRDDVNLSTIATVGYAFAESPAIFGVVAAVTAGEGWRVLPFAVIALVGWGLVRGYLANLQQVIAADEFPRL